MNYFQVKEIKIIEDLWNALYWLPCSQPSCFNYKLTVTR